MDSISEEYRVRRGRTEKWKGGSYRLDSNYYLGKRFRSLEELRRSVKRYCSRYNNISRKVLNFKSPNEMLKEYRTNN